MGIAGWLGTCPCHPRRDDESAHALRRRRGASMEDRNLGDCPCVGMWGPHIVAGELQSRLVYAFDSTQTSDMLEDTLGLSAVRRAGVFAGWQVARSYIEYNHTLKLHFTTVLPGLMVGIMHPDETVARRIAGMCVQQWDAATPDAHHRQTVQLMGKNEVRAEIARFRAGTRRAELGDPFWHHVGPLKFINVVERLVEALHALVKARGGRNLTRPLASCPSSFAFQSSGSAWKLTRKSLSVSGASWRR